MKGKHFHILLVLLSAVTLLLVMNQVNFWPPFTAPLDGATSVVQKTGLPASGSSNNRPGQATVSSPSFTLPESATDSIPTEDPMLATLRARLEHPSVVPHEALLSFRSKEALDRFLIQAASRGIETRGLIPQLNAVRVRYETLEGLRDGIAANAADAATVEGNLWLHVLPPPPQAATNNQGGATPFGEGLMSAIQASGDRSAWGEAVTVAVVDTGVQAHPTFGEGQVTHLDLVNDGRAFHGHGTSVASLIGGQNPQAPGVAPAAKLLDVRVANADGFTVSSVLAQGIIAATDHGARVINISLGGYGDSTVLGQALDYAFQRGAVVVAAAGNDGYDQLAIPAAYTRVISVGSVDALNHQAYFSNSGEGLDLMAPGVGVITAWGTDRIASASGTSQSSALVAGAVAAYLGWGMSSNDVAARLKADSRRTGSPARQMGVGILSIRPTAGR